MNPILIDSCLLGYAFLFIRILGRIGSFTCCRLGAHDWSITYSSSDIDIVANTVTPISLRWECGHCDTTKTIKPGSRAWRKHWNRASLSMNESQWQQHRYGQLLSMGNEIDIVTGEPVEDYS
jgi:hypothetical protein